MLEIHKESSTIHKDSSTASKTQFTHSLLPSYIDAQNVSTKKIPFSTFNSHHFSHTLDLVLPTEVYELVRAHLEDEDNTSIGRGQYARVFMKLEDILHGDFFNKYIKMGNIMMRSEGRADVDNIISLYEGVLRIEVDRPTYQRLGLHGKAIEDGGRKHQKGRWVVETDLRQPSMLHGKKGFGRLEWAAKNVLNTSLTWLFCNFNPGSREALPAGQEPISIHQPFVHNIAPHMETLPKALAPNLKVGDLAQSVYEQENSMALLEYLHLVAIASPRINSDDNIDPFLCRYEVPDLGNGVEERSMTRVRWRGFISPLFIRELFLAVRKEGLKIEKADHDGEGGTLNQGDKRWFAVSAKGFEGGDAYTVLQFAGRETLCWDML